MWGFIKGELFKYNNDLKDADQTWEKIQEIWYNEVKLMLPKLYDSLNDRFKEVTEANGCRINH